jgi:hypothetical protein
MRWDVIDSVAWISIVCDTKLGTSTAAKPSTPKRKHKSASADGRPERKKSRESGTRTLPPDLKAEILSKNLCLRFNFGICTRAAPHALKDSTTPLAHKCGKCDSVTHGAVDCTEP